MKKLIGRHVLSSYFLLSYALSWSIAVPLALQAQGAITTRLPYSLHYLTAFGPATAAGLTTWLTRGGTLQTGSARAGSPIRSILWWTVGFASPLVLFAVAQLAVAVVAGATVPAWTVLGRISFLPDLGVAAWGLWFLTSGCGEELGWRGFALPRLQQTHSAMTSSVLLAIGWAGWHVPAFFYLPSYAALGLRILPGFFLGILAGAIVLTWLYNSSNGSVLAAVLWHASFNFVTASPHADGMAAAVTSVLVVAWALGVIWRCDWATLAWRPRLWRTAADETAASDASRRVA